MAIASIEFHNFKVFKEATLPLGRTTLIIGPNGAGKSTCMEAIRVIGTAARENVPYDVNVFRSLDSSANARVGFNIKWEVLKESTGIVLQKNMAPDVTGDLRLLRLSNAAVFVLEPQAIAHPARLWKTLQLNANGSDIPAVLTTLQDKFPERFEELNKDLASWLPEFDRILLDTPTPNTRAFMLRTKEGKHAISATQLSHGTLFAVAMLTLCRLPEPPTLIGIEDPDRGMHPRLLRNVTDAIHRLSHPEEFGDNRPPTQVVLTTHSPYLLDYFRDRLEDVVVVDKHGLYSSLTRVSDIPNIQDILGDGHLGESWYTGILNGVPVHT